ncbi:MULTISPECIES: alpha/beta hydrolase [unclassified Pseudovibrio]|uniref:alpha/beta hydrolase n=1 Tax=unclassified Pseudovibrio TaxID=2627060 RepID=UPI0007AE4B87|nr:MULTISPECIES: alpha/beta hydrolase [unclassified Pseudovibrio]KZL04077.1 Alpha/beta hydrolase family protein [Pseudovibrio sp. W74]KZL04296.1 Alpha/beta hydrolase family protein [Pseudovibrio sp. Ad14]
MRGNFRILGYLIGSLFMSALLVSQATGFELKPYKDELFAYPRVLDQAMDGAFLRLDYQIQRDLRDRDEIPERRVEGRYVSSRPTWYVRERSVVLAGNKRKHIRVGKPDADTKLLLLYLHGKGGNRKQGNADWTFGGNFNRLKNLMVRNNGVYLSPDVKIESPRGTQEIRELIARYRKEAPQAKVIVACGSMGSQVCYGLADQAGVAGPLSGLILLGGATDRRLLTSEAYKAGVPIVFGHGSADRVYSWEKQYQLFKAAIGKTQRYPVRFRLFETGSHGTPIRMIDWRDEINWMLSISSATRQ